jgi:hypothetical protein
MKNKIFWGVLVSAFLMIMTPIISAGVFDDPDGPCEGGMDDPTDRKYYRWFKMVAILPDSMARQILFIIISTVIGWLGNPSEFLNLLWDNPEDLPDQVWQLCFDEAYDRADWDKDGC